MGRRAGQDSPGKPMVHRGGHKEMPDSFLIAFMMPFHVAGGAAIGAVVHKINSDESTLRAIRNNAFLLLWGALFGGMPLVFGLTAGSLWVLALQIGLFLGAIIVVAWRYEWIRDLYSQPGMFVATFGLAFALIGIAVSMSILSEGDPGGLLVGLIFGGVGGLLTLVGIWLLLRSG